MALVSSYIGFVTETESEPGYTSNEIIERSYRGNSKKNNQQFSNANSIQGELRFTNIFSITGDSYLFKHITEMRYFVWQGEKWIMENVSYDFPRIEFTLGGIYHGSQDGTTTNSDGYQWG